VNRDEAVNFHEAAHATVAAALGFRDVFVEKPVCDETFNPTTRYTPPSRWGAEHTARRAVAVAYAGSYGEVLRFGQPILGPSENDVAEVRAALAVIPEQRRAAVSESEIARNRKVLAENWATVEWVAATLRSTPALWLEFAGGEAIISTARFTPMPSERFGRCPIGV
jgi:hypothetical protein